jgi:hypothetical protein
VIVIIRRFVGVATAVLVFHVGVEAQPIKKQLRDGGPVTNMTPAELSRLEDPLFLLVLKNQPQATKLEQIEKLLMGAKGERHLFVVHEDILDAALGQERRSVTAYKGTNQNVRLDPNVSLSLSFNDTALDTRSIEAWGWDNRRSRYNYYKLDGNPLTWKFRGSSVDADQLTPAQRNGTCLACHINGAPVMKELPIPWNNWHSFRSLVAHLSPTAPGHWKIAESLVFRDLKGAENLETEFVIPSIKQFNGRRISQLTRQNAAGQPVAFPGGLNEITDGPRLLRPLFQTTEYNITSAEQLSGLHPLPAAGTGPTEIVKAPATFFLNANLLAGGGITRYEGLGIPEARAFVDLLQLQPNEYAAVVKRFETKIGGVAGDANFAWLVPEASHVDNEMIDLLVRRGVVTRDFAAAVMLVDLETPVFSKPRESLLSFIPAQFRFRPLNPGDVPAAHPDALTQAVIAKLKTSGPAASSAAAEFLAALENPNPVELLRQKVLSYRERVRAALASTQQRGAEIDRLYAIVLGRRSEAVSRIPALVESPRLFPTGKVP